MTGSGRSLVQNVVKLSYTWVPGSWAKSLVFHHYSFNHSTDMELGNEAFRLTIKMIEILTSMKMLSLSDEFRCKRYFYLWPYIGTYK